MRKKSTRQNLPAMLTGMAVGAGIVLAYRSYETKNPDEAFVQRIINRALDRALRNARQRGSLPLGPDQRYVIFSDHHKGARNEADDFRQCEETYLKALDHYHANDYTLIILGDAEELWEETILDVLESYPHVLESESRFHPDRYIRVFGNHDDSWQEEDLVRQYLDPFFPGIHVHEGLVFEFTDGNGTSGDLFLIHGHQGTLDSDVLDFLGPWFLPYYRKLQIYTGIGRTSPSGDACLRARRDTQMYRWARQQEKLLLIAGHTHRPVWSSTTHLEKLIRQLRALEELPVKQRAKDHEAEVKRLKGEVKRREEKYPSCIDTIKTRPCYFNTGCCRFDDGDVTGIELQGGEIRLVKWGKSDGEVHRTALEESSLADIFLSL